MRIGIVGAGKIGGALSHRLVRLGHEVRVANSRGPETLADLASTSGAEAVSRDQAVREVNLVILAIPFGSVADLPTDLFADLPTSTPVIETCNYYAPRDGEIEALRAGTPDSRWIEQSIDHPVIKAFNTIAARHILERGESSAHADRIALPIAGDDQATKAFACRLVADLGFDPVDAGGLDESWRQQPGTPVYGALLNKDAVQAALRAATRADLLSQA